MCNIGREFKKIVQLFLKGHVYIGSLFYKLFSVAPNTITNRFLIRLILFRLIDSSFKITRITPLLHKIYYFDKILIASPSSAISWVADRKTNVPAITVKYMIPRFFF